jgi:CheY-like chemotaxis protein
MHGSLTTRTILLVDDNFALLKLIKALLEGAGFHILAANSPIEALNICRQRKFDLLLTDVDMPDLTGPELAMRVVTSAPDTRVLFMSGSDGNSLAEMGFSWIECGLLRKPFSPADLLNAVDGALDVFSAAAAPRPKADPRPCGYDSAKRAAI